MNRFGWIFKRQFYWEDVELAAIAEMHAHQGVKP